MLIKPAELCVDPAKKVNYTKRVSNISFLICTTLNNATVGTSDFYDSVSGTQVEGTIEGPGGCVGVSEKGATVV